MKADHDRFSPKIRGFDEKSVYILTPPIKLYVGMVVVIQFRFPSCLMNMTRQQDSRLHRDT